MKLWRGKTKRSKPNRLERLKRPKCSAWAILEDSYPTARLARNCVQLIRQLSTTQLSNPNTDRTVQAALFLRWNNCLKYRLLWYDHSKRIDRRCKASTKSKNAV